MNPEYDKLCELLGVDEIKISRGITNTTVSLRIGEKWMAAKIDFATLAESKNMQREVGNIVFDLARALKDSLDIAEAKGELLDQLAATAGVQRQVEQRKLNRFEAIAEELKKL